MLEHLEINAQKRRNQNGVKDSRLSDGTKNKLLNRIVEETPMYTEDFSDNQPDQNDEPAARMDIYQRGLRHKAQVNQRAENERQKKLQQEKKELTFKPKIYANKARAAVIREKGVKLEDVLLF